jgi:hypothetical protein
MDMITFSDLHITHGLTSYSLKEDFYQNCQKTSGAGFHLRSRGF